MLKRIQRLIKWRAALSTRWRQAAIVIGLLLSLITASTLMAQHETVRSAGHPAKEQAQKTTVSPASLTPASPTKEYVYLGGKLVATEEPAP